MPVVKGRCFEGTRLVRSIGHPPVANDRPRITPRLVWRMNWPRQSGRPSPTAPGSPLGSYSSLVSELKRRTIASVLTVASEAAMLKVIGPTGSNRGRPPRSVAAPITTWKELGSFNTCARAGSGPKVKTRRSGSGRTLPTTVFWLLGVVTAPDGSSLTTTNPLKGDSDAGSIGSLKRTAIWAEVKTPPEGKIPGAGRNDTQQAEAIGRAAL